MASARRLGLEGMFAKRKDAPYESRRTQTWLKLKNRLRQEFVIAGYSDRSSGEAQIGSLLLGVYDETQQLVSVGKVGTDWTAETAARLQTQLKRIERAQAPFGAQLARQPRWSPAHDAAARHWVAPKLVAEVEFAGWTPDGQLRHARFVGLRSDKQANAVRRESSVMPPTALPLPASSLAGSRSVVGGIAISHPDRSIDASTGITKIELVRYYASMAEWMLPHLNGRPCALVRGPGGIGGELFFQKHAATLGIAGVRELAAALWPGHAPLLEVPTIQALIACAQMYVIEFHTWNVCTRNIDRPDRIFFDLDPGEGERLARVLEAATLVRGLLHELGLQSWLKTSGGKGLHVVVPLTPRAEWDTAKAFARALVQRLARVAPQRFVARSGSAHRVGKVFVDYLRNNRGATTVAAFSARARPGLGVSMPVAWDEMPLLLRGDQWTLRTAPERIATQAADPWQDYWTTKQTLTSGLKALGLGRPV